MKVKGPASWRGNRSPKCLGPEEKRILKKGMDKLFKPVRGSDFDDLIQMFE